MTCIHFLLFNAWLGVFPLHIFHLLKLIYFLRVFIYMHLIHSKSQIPGLNDWKLRGSVLADG